MRHPQRLLLTLAALITVSSCKSEAPKPPPPKVQAVSTQMAEFTEGVDTVSTLEASNLVELAAQSGGRILELKIRQGDEVEAGQLLVVLDQEQQRARLAEDKAKADTAKVNYERYQYLAQTGAASQKELDRYRTQFIAAQEKVKSTEATLNYNNLIAPSPGMVADVTVKVGDVIQQGQVFTSLVQNNELEARVEVPAVFSSRLELGQPVLLSAPGSYDVIATGEVGSIDPRVNKQTQGLLVKAVFPNTMENFGTASAFAPGFRSRPRTSCRFPLPLSPRHQARALCSASERLMSSRRIPAKPISRRWRRASRPASSPPTPSSRSRHRSRLVSWRTSCIRSPKVSSRTRWWSPPTCST